MDPFDYNPSLSYVYRAMGVLGISPKLKSDLKYKTLSYVVLILIGGGVLSSFLGIIAGITADTSEFIYAICMALASTQATEKLIILMWGKTRLVKVLAFLENPQFACHGNLNKHTAETLRKYGLYQYVIIFLVLGTSVMLMFNPLFGISERLTPLTAPVDMKQQSVAVYTFTCVIQSLMGYLSGIVVSAYDCLFLVLVGVARSQIAILRHNISTSTDYHPIGDESSSLPENYNLLVNKTLKKCIEHHMKIQEYIDTIQDLFAIPLLIQLVFSLIVMVFVGFSCVITPITSPMFVKTINFFLAVICELALFCVLGNILITQSENIMEACYMAKWNRCDASVRKTLFIFMERTKRPFILTAGNFVSLSIETLLAVVKSSFSYFTVLRHMYSDSATN